METIALYVATMIIPRLVEDIRSGYRWIHRKRHNVYRRRCVYGPDYRVEGYSWWPKTRNFLLLSLAILSISILSINRVLWSRTIARKDCRSDQRFDTDNRTPTNGGKLDPRWASRTRQALQAMWSAHSPELWIFGHWHKSFDHVLRGTRFICLAELEYIDIDL